MDWSVIFGVFIGGFFTLLGGWLQVSISDRKTEIRRNEILKKELLTEFMSNRIALSKDTSTDLSNYRTKFISSINKIHIIYSDNTEVMKKLNIFENAIYEGKGIDIPMYDLVKSMYEDLNLEVLSQEKFFKFPTF